MTETETQATTHPSPTPALHVPRIFVPTDLRSDVEMVLTHARMLALALGGTVTVFHAVPGPLRDADGVFLPVGEEETLRAERGARDRLATLAAEFHLPEPLVHRAPHGVARAVLARIEDLQPDLVVLGAHGHEGLHLLHPDSVGDAVLRHVAAPVLCVHGERPGLHLPCRRILVLTDLTEASRAACRWGGSLARAFGADMLVLLVPRPDEPQAACERDVHEFAAAALAGVRFAVQVEAGTLPEKVVEVADVRGADMLVVPRETRRGVVGWLLGTPSEKTARRATCPVLLA